MAEMQGMLAVTPELEAQGRMGDTEVGTIDIDALVLPKDVLELDEAQEFLSELGNLYNQFDLDMSNFTVSAGSTNYSIEENNTQAHLTNGELVIPPGILQAAEGLTDILSELYTLAESNINQYTVGNEANSINPETGLPEFFGFVKKLIKKVTKPIKSIFDKAKDLVSDAWKGIKTAGSTLWSGVKKVAKSPIGQIALSVALPGYAPYINAAYKLSNGQKLSAADFISLGVRGYNDITGGNFAFDPDALKAVNAIERVADGADIKDVFISTYGKDFVQELGIDTKVKDALGGFTDNDTVNWLSENIDLNQAAADLMGGSSPYTLLSNQFGDKVANYIGQDDPNLKALGYAGIRVGQAIDDGADTKDALYRGAREYYDKGGQLPNFGDIADTVKDLLPDIDIETPNLNMTDWLKSMDIDVSNIFDKFKIGDVGSMDLDWNALNIGDYDFSQLKDIFNTQGISIPDAPDLGVNLSDIDLGKLFDFTLRQGVDIETPQKSKLAQLAEQQQEEDTFKNPLLGKNPLLETEELPISRQLLSSINLGTTV